MDKASRSDSGTPHRQPEDRAGLAQHGRVRADRDCSSSKTVVEKANKDEVQGAGPLLQRSRRSTARPAARRAGRSTRSSPRSRQEAADLMERAVKLAPDAKVGERNADQGGRRRDRVAEDRSRQAGPGHRRDRPGREEGQAVELSRQGGAARLLGDLVRAVRGDDSARARPGREAEGQAVRPVERERRRREGGADRVHRQGQDAVGPLVGRFEGAGVRRCSGCDPTRRCSSSTPRASCERSGSARRATKCSTRRWTTLVAEAETKK